MVINHCQGKIASEYWYEPPTLLRLHFIISNNVSRIGSNSYPQANYLLLMAGSLAYLQQSVCLGTIGEVNVLEDAIFIPTIYCLTHTLVLLQHHVIMMLWLLCCCRATSTYVLLSLCLFAMMFVNMAVNSITVLSFTFCWKPLSP